MYIYIYTYIFIYTYLYSYRKLPLIVNFAIKHCDFPYLCKRLPDGNMHNMYDKQIHYLVMKFPRSER